LNALSAGRNELALIYADLKFSLYSQGLTVTRFRLQRLALLEH